MHVVGYLTSLIIHLEYFPNSDWLKAHAQFTITMQVTYDQIWKNFVFNEEMTSKMQLSTG